MRNRIRFATTLAGAVFCALPNLAMAQPCSNASLQGTYGFNAFGANVSSGSPGTPRAVIGIFTMDGHGGWTANVTINDGGNVINTGPVAGTYHVNADCTGLLFTNPGSVMLVVVDGGKEFYQLRIDPATFVVIGTTKRVSSGDNGGNQQ